MHDRRRSDRREPGRALSLRFAPLYRSGRVNDWLKIKNPKAPAVKREAEEDWGEKRWARLGRRK